MNTEYGYRKQVESHHQGSKHTLAILMSKLRSSLGAAWEQARSSLEYTYSMLMTTFLRPFSSKRAELERRLVPDEITARPSRDYVSSLTRLRLVLNEITARYIPAPDAHSRKQQCLGTGLFGNVLYRKL